MQIVIEIDENVFTRLFDNGTEDYTIVNDDLFKIAKSIRKGTPLPKGHGRLIDMDKLCNDLIKRWKTADKKKEIVILSVMADVVTPIIVSQPTILEATEGTDEDSN